MQANSTRIDNTSITEVSELTDVLGKIFVDLLGPKIYVQRVKSTSETKVRRVGSAENGNILSNYLDKQDYAVVIKSLNEEELERFKETREITPKIRQIIQDSKNKEGSKVQDKAVTFSRTPTIVGKRPAPEKDSDHPKKKAKTGKEKRGKKGSAKPKSTNSKDKKKKRKKDTSGSTRRTAIVIGEEINTINHEKSVKNVCNLSTKIQSINIGEKKSYDMDEID